MDRFTAESTGRAIRAVLFDTFGTVVDWRSGIASAATAFFNRNSLTVDPVAFADAWRAEYQPAMRRVRSGERAFVDLDTLHRENLDVVFDGFGIDATALPGEDVDSFAGQWRNLPPWPDSVPGISSLRTEFIVGPLSNANTSLLVDMAKYARLPWDVVLGSDVSRAYKPAPAAYLTPVQLLRLDPGEVMLVAAHNSDLAAARAAGLASGFVVRPHEYGVEQTTDLEAEQNWDVAAASLVELAATLVSDG